MNTDDTDLLLDEVDEEPGHRFFFYAASLATPEGGVAWWSATQIVRVALVDLLRLAPGNPVTGTIVSDLDPLGSGLDETHGRYEADWCDRKPEPVTVTGWPDLGPAVTEETWVEFRRGRAAYRTVHGLPRHVIRSDVYDPDTGTRAPLHALRHPWPPGAFLQGGTASRTVELGGADGRTDSQAAAEAGLPADAQVVTRRTDGVRVAVVRDRVFIEVFPPPTPDNPSGGFLRGQGVTFADAEDAAWAKWTAKQGCPAVAATGSHRWEARGYRNGAGFCADCNVFGSGVFTPEEIGCHCAVCGVGTFWQVVTKPDGLDGAGEWLLCQTHAAPGHDDASEALYAAAATGQVGGPAGDLVRLLLDVAPAGTTVADLNANVDLRFKTLEAARVAHVERLLPRRA